MNFRQLIDAARCKGRADHLRPRTMMWVARVTDVSRPQIYNLINGSQTAPLDGRQDRPRVRRAGEEGRGRAGIVAGRV